MKLEFRRTECNICRADDFTPLREVKRFKEGVLHFVTCNSCGLIYQNPRPTEASLLEFFSSTDFMSSKDADRQDDDIAGYYDYIAGENFRMRLAKYRLRKVEGLFGNRSKELRILKIACGTGTFLKVAQDVGHEVLGVDASKPFVAYAREHYMVPMIESTFESADLGDRKFDAILLMGALGNVNDLRLCMEKIVEHLEDDGFFMFNCFDMTNLLERIQKENYWLYRPPAVYLFTREQIKGMVRRFGLDIVRLEQDIQYTNLAKLVGNMGIKPVWWLVQVLKLHNVVVKVPMWGGYLCVVGKKLEDDG